MCLQVSQLLQRVEASIRKHFNGIAVQEPAHIAPHAPTNAPPRPPDARTQASRSGATHDHDHHDHAQMQSFISRAVHIIRIELVGWRGREGDPDPASFAERRAHARKSTKKRCGRRRGGGGRRSRECRRCGRKGEKETEETKAKHYGVGKTIPTKQKPRARIPKRGASACNEGRKKGRERGRKEGDARRGCLFCLFFQFFTFKLTLRGRLDFQRLALQ